MKTDMIPRHSITSGNYFVGKSENKILDAYLGTCVGLSLCDKRADIARNDTSASAGAHWCESFWEA